MEQHTVIVNLYGYSSSTEKEYRGNLNELIENLRGYLGKSKPRTISGLEKQLNKYSKEHKTTYTGVVFSVY